MRFVVVVISALSTGYGWGGELPRLHSIDFDNDLLVRVDAETGVTETVAALDVDVQHCAVEYFQEKIYILTGDRPQRNRSTWQFLIEADPETGLVTNRAQITWDGQPISLGEALSQYDGELVLSFRTPGVSTSFLSTNLGVLKKDGRVVMARDWRDDIDSLYTYRGQLYRVDLVTGDEVVKTYAMKPGLFDKYEAMQDFVWHDGRPPRFDGIAVVGDQLIALNFVDQYLHIMTVNRPRQAKSTSVASSGRLCGLTWVR